MSPNINPEHVITLQGQQYCTYRGVLECAHNLGLEGIRTRIVQVPGPDNDHVAIVEAEVRLKDGRVFADVADASPKNVHARLSSALIRMASTRAKGRALRDAVNIGEALAEELADAEADQPASSRAAGAPRPAPRPTVPQRPALAADDGDAREVPAQPAREVPAQPAREVPAQPAREVPAQPAREVPAQPAREPLHVVSPPAEAVPEAPAPAPTPAAAPAAEHVCSSADCGRSVTQGQYNFSVQKYGKPLCPACQRKQQSREKAPA